MKKLLIAFLMLISISFESLAQQNEVTELLNKQKEISNHIKILTDSIKRINLKINDLKSKEIKKIVIDSTLKGIVKNGAKVKKTASPLGELITSLNENKEVIILDYVEGYFNIYVDSIYGYISDVWIKKNDKIKGFINVKETEEKEQKLQKEKDEYEKLENHYIERWGQKTYDKIKQGDIWIGMTEQMAIMSYGRPNDVNRTVGSWGSHEQWVYDKSDTFRVYLYFENGILTSMQY